MHTSVMSTGFIYPMAIALISCAVAVQDTTANNGEEVVAARQGRIMNFHSSSINNTTNSQDTTTNSTEELLKTRQGPIMSFQSIPLNNTFIRQDTTANRQERVMSFLSTPIKNTKQLTSFREGRRSGVADSCITNDDSTGTCMSRFKCLNSGGTPKGYCGSYGVCCETNLQCNDVSKLKRTIIRNPPLFSMDPCTYTIYPYSPNVCQLLIEFQRFELQPPTLDAGTNTLTCNDNLSIGDFTLCGDNSGQHLYLPFNVASGINEIRLRFNLPNRWSQTSWRMVITQLECPVPTKRSQTFMPFVNGNNLNKLRTIFSTHHSDVDLLAPPGCNQYYTLPMGTIKSFNYKPDATSFYLPNMNYVICIKSVAGASMIEYKATKFSLSNQNPLTEGYDSDCHSTVKTEGRREDYLMIPQSFVANSMNYLPTYYCGTSLQKRPTLLASAPFVMYFSSDGFTDETETGFSINYNVKSIF